VDHPINAINPISDKIRSESNPRKVVDVDVNKIIADI